VTTAAAAEFAAQCRADNYRWTAAGAIKQPPVAAPQHGVPRQCGQCRVDSRVDEAEHTNLSKNLATLPFSKYARLRMHLNFG